MLTLTRRNGESIEIGRGIVITVWTENYRGQIKLSIEAPPEVRIVRSELLEREARERNGRDAGERPARR